MRAAERRVTTADGERIALTHHRTGSDRVLVIAHGFWQHRRTRLFARIARRLAEHSDVVSFDFRGHGQSSGWYTFSAHETADLLAVLAYVRQAYRRVSVAGFSMGTIAAVDAAARHPGLIDRLVLVSPPMAWEAIENRWWLQSSMMPVVRQWSFGWTLRLRPTRRPKPRSLELVGRVAPTPVLIIHGTDDPIIFPRHAAALHAAARPPKHLELVQGGWHAEMLFAQQPERLFALVGRWCNDAQLLEHDA